MALAMESGAREPGGVGDPAHKIGAGKRLEATGASPLRRSRCLTQATGSSRSRTGRAARWPAREAPFYALSSWATFADM